MDFLISRADLHETRLGEAPPPQARPGEAVLVVDSFGLSANNITYAVFGEAMSYWRFFPAEEGWGRMPVWGFAEVLESQAEGLEPGTRVFGYLPPSSELLVRPRSVDAQGFIDASPHRAELPPAYNAYARTDSDPFYDPAREAQQMLLRPLYLTSYLLEDFLAEAGFFGAESVVISSASSKTASALAFALGRRGGVAAVGLSSERGARFARELGVYEEVLSYEQLDSLPAGRAVYVDIAGDGDLRAAVHGHYEDELAHSAVVGATHHESMAGAPQSLPGPAPAFFFAPDRLSKRTADWGRAALQERMAKAWHEYVRWTDGWLQIIRESGPQALQRAYLDTLDGRVAPSSAYVLSLPRA